jgi:hypothetical protein
MIISTEDLKLQETEDILLQERTSKRAAIESLMNKFGGRNYVKLTLTSIKDTTKETLKTIGGTTDYHEHIDKFKSKEKLIFWLSEELFR